MLFLDDTLRSVNAFLDMARSCISQGNVSIVSRRKNREFAMEYGLTGEHLCAVVQKLHTAHRRNGPMEESDFAKPPGTLFDFLKKEELDGRIRPLYIKLKIPDGETRLLVLSIHVQDGADE